MSDAYEIVVPGPPPTKNSRHRLLRGRDGNIRRRNSARFLEFSGNLAFAWHLARISKSGQQPQRIQDGVWSVEILAYHARKSRRFEGLAHADADARISSVLDAMQHAGVIDDDMRIQRVTATKAHDPANPRTIIRLEKLR